MELHRAELPKADDFAARLEPIGRILDLSEQGCVVWSCAPIYGPDGQVHVFFTRVPPPQEDWFKSFRISAEIVHATAPRPEGPYTVHDVVKKGRGEGQWDGFGIVNPRVYRSGNQYALFFTSYSVPWPREEMEEHIGVLVSDDLWNWEPGNGGQPLLSPDITRPKAWDSKIVNNAAFVEVAESPHFRLYYRGVRTLDTFDIGLAVSDSLCGPYTRWPSNPVVDSSALSPPHGGGFRGLEDPCVWVEDGVFKMLTKDCGYLPDPGGCYQVSRDGIQWSAPVRGYCGARYYWNEDGALDSPLLLFDDQGRPEYLFTNRFTDGRATGFIFKVHRGLKSPRMALPSNE